MGRTRCGEGERKKKAGVGDSEQLVLRKHLLGGRVGSHLARGKGHSPWGSNAQGCWWNKGGCMAAYAVPCRPEAVNLGKQRGLLGFDAILSGRAGAVALAVKQRRLSFSRCIFLASPNFLQGTFDTVS